jgi:hypothetical protein
MHTAGGEVDEANALSNRCGPDWGRVHRDERTQRFLFNQTASDKYSYLFEMSGTG